MGNQRKALFLDMDGTTLDDQKKLSEENRRAICRTLEAGHEVVVSTGRPTASAKKFLEAYGLTDMGCHYVIAFNGGQVVDFKTGEIFYTRSIPFSCFRQIVELAKEMDVYVHAYEDAWIVTDRDDENLELYKKRIRMPAKIVDDLGTALSQETCKVLAVDVKSKEPLKRFQKRLMERLGDQVDSFFSCSQYLEIVPKGVNKGEAILAFCKNVGIDPKWSVAAGDEGNDLSMIQAAGTGCAVANASLEVKAAADYITLNDNNHSAVAEIIEKFVL